MQEKQIVHFRDLGKMDYKKAWDYQEALLKENLDAKRAGEEVNREQGTRKDELMSGILDGPEAGNDEAGGGMTSFPPLESVNKDDRVNYNSAGTEGASQRITDVEINERISSGKQTRNQKPETRNYLLFVEHPPVYTLGKSGKIDNVLINEHERKEKGIEFYQTNRGGDITFHGPDQVVGYPIIDLEKFYTDIGRYLRELEEVIILTLDEYGIVAGRSQGETGVWIDQLTPGKERKICAMGVRCSRWITMHGFALNVNTDLNYFNHIIPCGIANKKVTSIKEELGRDVPMEDVKEKLRKNFAKVFDVEFIYGDQNDLGR